MASQTFYVLKSMLVNVINPLNASFMVLLNMSQIAFIVAAKLDEKISSMPYILCLTVADFLLGLMVFTVKAMESAANITKSQVTSSMGIYFENSMTEFSLMTSVLTVTMLTVDRWMAATSPAKYKKFTLARRRFICIAIWMVTLGVNHISREYGTSSFKYSYTALIALFAIPFPMFAFIYIKFVMKKSESASQEIMIFHNADEAESSLFNLTVKIFIAYCVCVVPYMIYAILEIYQLLDKYDLILMNNYTNALILINASLNPAICLHHFRVHNVIKERFETGNKTQPAAAAANTPAS